MMVKIRQDWSVFVLHIFEYLFVETSPNISKYKIVGIIYRPDSQYSCDIMSIINIEQKPQYCQERFKY